MHNYHQLQGLGILAAAYIGVQCYYAYAVSISATSRLRFYGFTQAFNAITAFMFGVFLGVPFYTHAALAIALFALGLIISALFAEQRCKRAVRQVEHARQTSAWALKIFSCLTEGGNPSTLPTETLGADCITTHSIESQLLNANTKDDGRRMLGFLLQNLGRYGHKLAECQTFAMNLDQKSTRSVTHSIVGFDRSDLKNWPLKVAAENKGWLPKG